MNFVFSLSSQISCIYSTNTLNILSEQFQNSSSHEYNFILRKHLKNMLNVKGEHETLNESCIYFLQVNSWCRVQMKRKSTITATVGTPVGIPPKYNRKNVERGKVDVPNTLFHDFPHFLPGTGT